MLAKRGDNNSFDIGKQLWVYIYYYKREMVM